MFWSLDVFSWSFGIPHGGLRKSSAIFITKILVFDSTVKFHNIWVWIRFRQTGSVTFLNGSGLRIRTTCLRIRIRVRIRILIFSSVAFNMSSKNKLFPKLFVLLRTVSTFKSVVFIQILNQTLKKGAKGGDSIYSRFFLIFLQLVEGSGFVHIMTNPDSMTMKLTTAFWNHTFPVFLNFFHLFLVRCWTSGAWPVPKPWIVAASSSLMSPSILLEGKSPCASYFYKSDEVFYTFRMCLYIGTVLLRAKYCPRTP